MNANTLYANAVIGIYANKLLTKHQERRMTAAANFTDAARVLFECGYDENNILHAGGSADYIIGYEMNRTAERFKSLCPDPNLLACVMSEYDYHNARIIYKSLFSKADLYEAAYPYGGIDLDKLKNAIETKNYIPLPDGMAAALRKLDTVNAPTANTVDLELNYALSNDIKRYARQIKNKKIKQYYEERAVKKHHYTLPHNYKLTNDNVFSLEFLFNWFMLKQAELKTVKAILMGKSLGLRGRWWE